MTILELKARFGELAIEMIKLDQHRQKIINAQQETLNALAKAEQEEVEPLQPEKPEA